MKHRWALTVLFLPFACTDAAGPPDATPTAPVAEIDDSPFTDPGSTERGALASEAVSVTIDVRPSTEVNPIVLHSGSVVPVALMAQSGFDPSDVDPASLAFGPPSGPFAAPLHDLATECALEDHLQDVDGDGDLDLVTHYSLSDLGFEVGDTEGCLTGALQSGPSIMGCDEVDVRP